MTRLPSSSTAVSIRHDKQAASGAELTAPSSETEYLSFCQADGSGLNMTAIYFNLTCVLATSASYQVSMPVSPSRNDHIARQQGNPLGTSIRDVVFLEFVVVPGETQELIYGNFAYAALLDQRREINLPLRNRGSSVASIK